VVRRGRPPTHELVQHQPGRDRAGQQEERRRVVRIGKGGEEVAGERRPAVDTACAGQELHRAEEREQAGRERKNAQQAPQRRAIKAGAAQSQRQHPGREEPAQHLGRLGAREGRGRRRPGGRRVLPGPRRDVEVQRAPRIGPGHGEEQQEGQAEAADGIARQRPYATEPEQCDEQARRQRHPTPVPGRPRARPRPEGVEQQAGRRGKDQAGGASGGGVSSGHG
jgi:hypothetical protein